MKKKWAKVYFFNKLVVNPVILALFGNLGEFKYSYDIESFPGTLQLIRTIILVMFIDDFLYMIIHRLFHDVKFLYKFHKVHHEYDSPFSMIGEYAHPVEQVLANILPATITFSIVKTHMFVILFWLTYKTYTSAEGHCGFDFPWSFSRVFPFVYYPSYHDFHHSKNVGNFATSLYIFETIMGTNAEFFEDEYKQGKIQTRYPTIKDKAQ